MVNGHIGAIESIADNSAIRTYAWKDRDEAPRGYTQGMALGYARVFCKLNGGDAAAAEMAKADTGDAQRDALAHYAAIFQELGMDNSAPGVDTLRHLFVLLMGLGMRESSGQHCEGRDMSADNTDAETCETGLFQFSYDSRTESPLLPPLIQAYSGKQDFLATFRKGVTCSPSSWRNWGVGPGVAFQQLAKQCPAFAVEYAAVLLRNDRGHFGPINRHKAEVVAAADTLFREVETYLSANGITSI
jgi:hypothetical protein